MTREAMVSGPGLLNPYLLDTGLTSAQSAAVTGRLENLSSSLSHSFGSVYDLFVLSENLLPAQLDQTL